MMDAAFRYIIDNGVCSEAEYPYTARDDKCKTPCTPVVRMTGYRSIPKKDETVMMKGVKIAPVSVAIEASRIMFYSSGVYDGDCSTDLDHGVAIVAFGTERGKPYWTFKNSWGSGWGEQGYMRIIRGKNKCGIALLASLADVK